MADDCAKRLMDPEIQKKLFGDREIPESMVRRLVRDIEDIKISVDRDPSLGTYKSRVQEFIFEKQELNRIEKAKKATNLRKVKDTLDFVLQDAFKERPEEAFISILGESRVLANGTRNNISNRASVLINSHKNMIFGQLEKQGLTKLFVSGELDGQIRKGVHALHKNESLTGISEEAQKIASIVVAYNKMVFRDLRNAGVPVRDLLGYVSAQTHSPELAVAAGKEKWISDVMDLFGQDKAGMKRTFGVDAGNPDKMRKQLEKVYEGIINGKQGKSMPRTDAEFEDSLAGVGHSRSAADKLSESRYLRFDNPEIEQKYSELYGKGNIAETIAGSINSRARDIAMVERLGTNPRATFQANIERAADHYRAIGRDDLAAQLVTNPTASGENKYNNRLMSMFNSQMGDLDKPANNWLAQAGSGIRLLKSLSLLGMSGVKSFNNFSMASMAIKTQTGKNLFESVGETVKNFTANLPDKKRKELAQFFNTYTGDVQDIFMAAQVDTADFSMNKMNTGLSKALGVMLKWNGLEYLTEAMKGAHTMSFMEHVASFQGKAFETWPPELQASFLSAGISKHDAELISTVTDVHKGRTFAIPERLRNLDLDKIKEFAALNKETPVKYRRNLELKYQSLLHSGAMMASTTSGVREKSAVVRWQAGTPLGEMSRMMFLFKGFLFQAWNNSHVLANSKPDVARLQRGILMSQGVDALSLGKAWETGGVKGVGGSLAQRYGSKDIMTMAQLVLLGSTLTYIGDSLAQIAQGKEPKDPNSLRTWVESFSGSAAGGLYMDYVGTNYTKYKTSWVESVGGPVVQDFNTAQKLVSGLWTGELEAREAKRMSTKLARGFVPFQNFIWAKQAVDYLHYEVIDETLNPGSAKKRAMQIKNAERGNRR